MLAMDVWCFSKSTIRVDLEKHQTRLHYWGNSLCNFEESPLQLWGILLYNKQLMKENGSVNGPKQLGTFGASYLYPVFARIGVIRKLTDRNQQEEGNEPISDLDNA